MGRSVTMQSKVVVKTASKQTSSGRPTDSLLAPLRLIGAGPTASVGRAVQTCLEARGAALTVLEPTFSTKDPAGPILVTVLGMVAEMERKFIRERQ
jgi:hypothetical protein